MLYYLQEWNQLESASILAIFGPTEDRDTWVTELSLDMIQAFQVQDVLVTYAMCDRPAGQVFTPSVVIKKLICQLLEQSPGLILEAPEIFNSRIFRMFTDFDQACLLFGSIVARLSASATSLAIIIDRIDCCEADMTDSNQSQDLVGFLSGLSKKYSNRLKVIITSADEPPDDNDLPIELAMSTCAIATRTRPLNKESYLRSSRRRITFNISIPLRNSEGLVAERRYRKAVGLEQLYMLRRELRATPHTSLVWKKRLEPRSPRQNMIYRYFGLQQTYIHTSGQGITLWNENDGNPPRGTQWMKIIF